MDDPIKIIFKYKNAKRTIQYNTYIFIGLIDDTIKKILMKMKDLTIYDSFIVLSKKEIKTLTDFYGEFWYLKFFNTYHIAHWFSLFKQDKEYNKNIIELFGKEWFNKHIYKNVFDTQTKFEYGETIEENYLCH